MSGNRLGSTAGDHDLDFITSLVNCTKLKILVLDDNCLKASLVSSSIANLSTQINWISLGINEIHGTIPSGIENLVNLTFLSLESNQLTGTIPTSMGNLHEMRALVLGRNKLSGTIPLSLGNLTLLNYLYLYDNNLFGEIPSTLASPTLIDVILSNNNLTGSIPKELMDISSGVLVFNLSGNALTSSLPLELGNLINVADLDVSHNRLSGSLPNSLGKCVVMEDLRLDGNFFEGEIPEFLQSLRGLEYIDLSHNKFSGRISEYLGELPFLTYLNLSFNQLEGEVLTVGAFGNATIVSVEGNYGLCGGIPKLNLSICPTYSTNKHLVVKIVILVISIAASCFILLASFFIIGHWKSKSRKNINVSSPDLYNNQFRRVSYSDLHKATGGFSESNIIGTGSYGRVYEGVLLKQDRIAIAVKALNLQQKGASKSFMSECKALRRIRHRNLIKTLSACSSLDFKGNDFKALVFKLMPQGSLEGWLHPKVLREDHDHEPKRLNLLQKLNISIDIASALEYLHNHSDGIIVHGDLKPNNLLLDNTLTAHVSDFGLAKIISAVSSATTTHPNQSSSVVVKGSLGYIAPGMNNLIRIFYFLVSVLFARGSSGFRK